MTIKGIEHQVSSASGIAQAIYDEQACPIPNLARIGDLRHAYLLLAEEIVHQVIRQHRAKTGLPPVSRITLTPAAA